MNLFNQKLGSKRFIFTIILTSLLFNFLIVTDFFPAIRGIDWVWPYEYVPTWSKIFPSIIIIISVLVIFVRFEKLTEKELVKKEFKLLSTLIFLSFCFQLSVIHFSRAGLGVLLARTVDPRASGYFSSSLKIESIRDYLGNYHNIVDSQSLHANAHPPGTELLIYAVTKFTRFTPGINSLISNLQVNTESISRIWQQLLPYKKTGAIFMSIFIPFLSNLAIIPLYYLTKLISNSKLAVRAVVFYIFVPSVSLFTPLPDVIYPIFPILSLLMLLSGIKKRSILMLFISGLVLSIGVFFSLSMLSFILMFLVIFILQSIELRLKFVDFIIKTEVFILGIVLPYILLELILSFQSVQVFKAIMHILTVTISPRPHFIYLFYNIYDFLIFLGIPIAIIFLFLVKNNTSKIYKNGILVGLVITILALNFSGNVRGETGRLFIPFIPFVIVVVIKYFQKFKSFGTKHFIMLYLLQASQLLIMQEFWVPLW